MSVVAEHRPSRWLALPLLLLAASQSFVTAQSAADSSDDLEDVELTAEQIQAARAEAAENQELDPTVRTRVVELYDTALRSLKSVDSFVTTATRFEEEEVLSEARIRALQEELDQPIETVALSLPADATTSEIEERLTQARAELEAARQALTNEDQLSAQRAARRREIPALLGALNQRLTQIGDDVRQALFTELNPELREARQANLLARRSATEAEISALRAELRRHAARAPTLPLRRERAQRRVLRAQQMTDLLLAAAIDRRRAEMRETLAETRRKCEEAARRVPAVRPLAVDTEELAEMLSGSGGILIRLAEVTSDLSATQTSISETRQAFETSRRKWEMVGYRSDATLWWPTLPVDLERPGLLRREIGERQSQISDLQHQLLLWEEKQAASVSTSREALGAAAGQDLAAAREMLDWRRDLLDRLITAGTAYSNLLYELDLSSRELLAVTQTLESFVVARAIWAKSVPGSALPAVGDITSGVVWLFGNHAWPSVWKEALGEVRRTPLTALVGLITVVLLFWLRPWCRKWLEQTADRVSDTGTQAMRTTITTVAVTAVLAAPIPAAILLLSLLLEGASEYDVARAVAAGFWNCSILAAALELVGCAFRPRGLAEIHFGRPPSLTRAIFRNTRLALKIAVPLMFVSYSFQEAGMGFFNPPDLRALNNALGRVCFAAALFAISICGYRAMHPAAPVLTRKILTQPWTLRPRTSWLWLVVSLTLIPAVLAMSGYYLSAAFLVQYLSRTLWLALGLLLLKGLLYRWEVVKRRSLTPIRLEGLSPNDRESGEHVETVSGELSDLTVADTQVRQLFRFGIWVTGLLGLFGIWAEFIPTMGLLDQIQVWPSIRFLTDQDLAQIGVMSEGATVVREEAETVPAREGTASGAPLPVPGASALMMGTSATGAATTENAAAEVPAQPLMLSALLVGLVLMLATVLVARHIPNLLEFAVLPRMRLDSGARVAISTLVRYGIMIFGFGIAFARLGLGWSKIQWLAAALTFGLAFGLQEIFANFVSGLILLTERPIRVGDAVTIGTITGRVARIQMRATTVVGWDQSELIVPNKEFITGQLVNWTLSDPRVRVDVAVGVAYGSDVQAVKAALLEVARRHPLVLPDPAPESLFRAFGPSSLEFELRVFINFRDGRPRIQDELHVAIDNMFRERGIVIAFPQMDIHVKTAAEGTSPEPSATRPPSREKDPGIEGGFGPGEKQPNEV